LKIAVVAGEGAVNIIQQKTAVAPIVEVRDRNNLPVAGAAVTFSISGSGGSFGAGSTLTVVTNAAGQATAAGLTPTAAGALQINVTAAMQGQMATAVITQTNFATAQAAAAAAGTSGGAAGGGGGASGASTAGAGAAGGGGMSATTLGIIGGVAAAGGVGAAYATGAIGGAAEGNITFYGQVFATATFGTQASPCNGTFRAIGTGATCYMNPVSGATVSTTLDSNTATTDGAGNFTLVTTLPLSQIEECRTYTIIITASGHPTYSVNSRGFAGNKEGSSTDPTLFAITPPTPNMMSGC
jgi:hypothetical protein